MNIKTLVSIISDVSSGSTVPLNSLEVLTSPWPHGCSNTDSELVALLVSKDVRSSCPSSNGPGSRVEEEPLSVVFRVVVSDSKTELVSSNMLIPEECSVVSHSALDLELDSISKWLRWISDSLEVDVPCLVETVVARPEGSPLVVDISSSPDINALVDWVSDVLSASSLEEYLLEWLVGILSDDSSSALSPSLAVLV
jgi:hypothetical protein